MRSDPSEVAEASRTNDDVAVVAARRAVEAARLEADQLRWQHTAPIREMRQTAKQRQQMRRRTMRDGAKHDAGATKPWRDEAKIKAKKAAAKKARRKNR